MPRLTETQWKTVEAASTRATLARHGLPVRRTGSVLIASFNIRKLGSDKNRAGSSRKGRTPGAWRLLARSCSPFDLVAVQEVQDELAGLLRLQRDLKADHNRSMELLISDVAGAKPGGQGMTERMAFLYDRKRIDHTELSSEVTSDRAEVTNRLTENRTDFEAAGRKYAKALAEWTRKYGNKKGKKPAKPWFKLPTFLTFIRAPHVGSFRIVPKGNAKPLDFLAVNAHLLYGKNKDERLWEFLELVEWLSLRAKYPDKLYAENLMLLGDCNLETENLAKVVAAENPPADVTKSARAYLEWKIKSLNKEMLTSRKSADANFPLLDVHPRQGRIRTNARGTETYDQIGLFCRDKRLPRHEKNTKVTGKGDTYDYGTFRFTDLIAEVLEPAAWQAAVEEQGSAVGSPFGLMTKTAQNKIIKAVDTDVSDHLPAWIRLPRPK